MEQTQIYPQELVRLLACHRGVWYYQFYEEA